MRLSLRVIDLYEEKAVTGNSHRLLHFGTSCPKVLTYHIARKAYFRSPSFRISHSDRAGRPKGEIRAATISTRIPDAGSPPIVQANSPQAVAIRARILNTPAARECSKVSTASTNDSSRIKGSVRIYKTIRTIGPPL